MALIGQWVFVPLAVLLLRTQRIILLRTRRILAALRARLVPYRAVGVSQGLLLAVRCERKGKKGKITPALAAFSPTPVSSGGDYEALTGGAA